MVIDEPEKIVAPFTGAWIEILDMRFKDMVYYVAPFTGAWIEIDDLRPLKLTWSCRSLHGCVD